MVHDNPLPQGFSWAARGATGGSLMTLLAMLHSDYLNLPCRKHLFEINGQHAHRGGPERLSEGSGVSARVDREKREKDAQEIRQYCCRTLRFRMLHKYMHGCCLMRRSAIRRFTLRCIAAQRLKRFVRTGQEFCDWLPFAPLLCWRLQGNGLIHGTVSASTIQHASTAWRVELPTRWRP